MSAKFKGNKSGKVVSIGNTTTPVVKVNHQALVQEIMEKDFMVGVAAATLFQAQNWAGLEELHEQTFNPKPVESSQEEAILAIELGVRGQMTSVDILDYVQVTSRNKAVTEALTNFAAKVLAAHTATANGIKTPVEVKKEATPVVAPVAPAPVVVEKPAVKVEIPAPVVAEKVAPTPKPVVVEPTPEPVVEPVVEYDYAEEKAEFTSLRQFIIDTEELTPKAMRALPTEYSEDNSATLFGVLDKISEDTKTDYTALFYEQYGKSETTEVNWIDSLPAETKSIVTKVITTLGFDNETVVTGKTEVAGKATDTTLSLLSEKGLNALLSLNKEMKVQGKGVSATPTTAEVIKAVGALKTKAGKNLVDADPNLGSFKAPFKGLFTIANSEVKLAAVAANRLNNLVKQQGAAIIAALK